MWLFWYLKLCYRVIPKRFNSHVLQRGLSFFLEMYSSKLS